MKIKQKNKKIKLIINQIYSKMNNNSQKRMMKMKQRKKKQKIMKAIYQIYRIKIKNKKTIKIQMIIKKII